MKTTDAILIVGGYGVVGEQVAHAIRERYPELPIIIAGRNLEKATIVSNGISNSQSIKIDVTQENPLNGLKPRAVIAAVNDPYDCLILDAVRNGIPYVDITRWTERVREISSVLKAETFLAPVLLSSGWMAGAASVVVIAMTRQLQKINSIDISVLYSLKDKAGPNSAEYMDRLITPFTVMLQGKPQEVLPYTDPMTKTFPGGYTTKAYRFDTPDQFTLPVSTGAATVSARIAFDDASAANFLIFLIRSGIWKLISGKRFTALRRSLLFNPGKGAHHEIIIDIAGLDAHQKHKNYRATIDDPKGQTHLTAVGALIQLERLLGIDGNPPPGKGIFYPDTSPDTESALNLFKQFDIAIKIDEA